MSYSPFTVTITNVAGSLFAGEVTLMTVPSLLGDTTILAHHEPLVTLLKKGILRIIDVEGNEKEFAVESGVLEVAHNSALVLV
jgi:F0F1-type ATP synthase epsilon subunit